MNTVWDTHLPPVGQLAGTHDAPTHFAGTHDAQPFQASCTAIAPAIPSDEHVNQYLSVQTASGPQVWWWRQDPDGRIRVQKLADRFRELADRWEDESMFLSNSEQATALPSHDVIVKLGDQAVPLILKRMQTQGGHWFHALQDITKEDPVDPADWGNVAAMQRAWLRWGQDNGRI